jgi:hypothetical protein
MAATASLGYSSIQTSPADVAEEEARGTKGTKGKYSLELSGVRVSRVGGRRQQA